MEVLTSYGCFTHWWACLPAIPPDRDAVDWWAAGPDGRATRYERLKRVWFDPTRFLAPKNDPCRPHEFAKPQHGTHLTCKIWETFCIFDPADWVPALMKVTGMEPAGQTVDAAWSFEFEAMVGATRRFKLADIVLQTRDAAGHDMLVVVEVKRPGDKLKEDLDLPDTEPASYLDREAFADIPHRRLIYLVDASYADIVREKVNRHDPRWGVVTWADIAQLQFTLAASLPQPLADLVRLVLAWQSAGPQFSGIPLSAPSPDPEELSQWAGRLAAAGPMPQYLSDFTAGAMQFLHYVQGRCPAVSAFPYLVQEPSFADLHRLPSSDRQTIADRRKMLWRLPAPAGRQPQNPPKSRKGADEMLSRLFKKQSASSLERSAAEVIVQPHHPPVPARKTSFPNPVSLAEVLGPPDAQAVQTVLRELRNGSGPLGGITIGRKGGSRALCYVGPLPTGADRKIRETLSGRYQVSAVRDPAKISNYDTLVGDGFFLLPSPASVGLSESQQPHVVLDSHRDGTLSGARKVLGVAEGADLAVVQAAYRALASKYHPDRFAGQSSEEVAAAQQRFMELKRAYDTVMDQEHGSRVG